MPRKIAEIKFVEGQGFLKWDNGRTLNAFDPIIYSTLLGTIPKKKPEKASELIKKIGSLSEDPHPEELLSLLFSLGCLEGKVNGIADDVEKILDNQEYRLSDDGLYLLDQCRSYVDGISSMYCGSYPGRMDREEKSEQQPVQNQKKSLNVPEMGEYLN